MVLAGRQVKGSAQDFTQTPLLSIPLGLRSMEAVAEPRTQDETS